jgi:hypothetical protein
MSKEQTDWVLVPREPTEEMLREGAGRLFHGSELMAKHCYEAMLSAAPKPSTSTAEAEPVAVTDDLVEAILFVYRMKVREYDADFRRDTPEGFWEKKYGTNLHSTGLGERWALKCALDTVATRLTAALATPLTEGGGRNAVIEECAKVADRFGCGVCGMDGKTGEAIRALKSGAPDA